MMQGKICMVTGANSGMGKVVAQGLAREGATVVMGCRDMRKGQEALAVRASRPGTPLKTAGS